MWQIYVVSDAAKNFIIRIGWEHQDRWCQYLASRSLLFEIESRSVIG